MAHREHVPARAFAPGMYPGYRSDVNASSFPKISPIQLGHVRLTDLLSNATRVVPGAHDLVLNTVPYGVMKLYLTWPCYASSAPLPIDLYEGGNRPTRASVAARAAMLFVRYLNECKTHNVHPSAAKWRIVDGGLGPANIIVNHLVNTHENIWQLDCDIVY